MGLSAALFGGNWNNEANSGSRCSNRNNTPANSNNNISGRGSNSNGEYVRFADGTQICQQANISMGSTVLGTALYYSNEVTWTFPASFLDKPRSVFGSDSGSTRLFGVGTCHSATESFIVLAANAAYSNRAGYFTAIGRWF